MLGRVSSPSSAPAGSGIRALVVEDEPDLAEALTRMLALEGWETEHALDGGTAVRPGPRRPSVLPARPPGNR
jgi:two-component system OmpR family response regulator